MPAPKKPSKEEREARQRIVQAKTAKLVQYSTVKVMLDQAIGELLQKLNALERLLLPAVPIPDGPSNIDDICNFDQALTFEVAKMILAAGKYHRKQMRLRYDQFVGAKPPDHVPTTGGGGIDDIMVSPPSIDELIDDQEGGDDDDNEGSVN